MDEVVTQDLDRAGQSELDWRFARAAIGFGRRSLGLAAPNPSVGALLVREGLIVGRGVTMPGGRPHAETIAIADAGEAAARGATMYVSLEPCAHFGATPPCASAIIEAGVARVVSSLDDPDSRVAGRGHRMLREAGVEVVTGIAAAEARLANLGHITRVTLGRPMVTLKLAETADGFVAGDAHDPRLMITGRIANNRVQMMRAEHDAIMIGAATARIDDPLMTVRLPGMDDRKPVRIVLDAALSLLRTSRLVATAKAAPVLVLCGEDAPRDRASALIDAGIEVERIAGTGGNRLDLPTALQHLGARGLTRVFSEGGPRVASELIRQGLVEEVAIFTSPKPLSRQGVVALAPEARARLDGGAFELVQDSLAGIDRLRIWRRKD